MFSVETVIDDDELSFDATSVASLFVPDVHCMICVLFSPWPEVFAFP
jgi:hypothetical protein